MTAIETNSVASETVNEKKTLGAPGDTAEKQAAEKKQQEGSITEGENVNMENPSEKSSSEKVEGESKETSKDEKGAGDSDKQNSDEKDKSEESEDLGVEAVKCLTAGKRHYIVEDYYLAVEHLEKACQLMAAKYGNEQALECAEPLLYYGKSLLELHRKESGALDGLDDGAAGQDYDDDDDDEDSDEDEDNDEKEKEGSSSEDKNSADEEEDLEKPDPALKDSKLDAEKTSEGKSENKEKPEAKEGSSKSSEGTTSEKGEAKTDKAAKSNEGGSGDKDAPAAQEEEDDVSNLQLAFEVLDLAKKIYKREAVNNPDLYLKAADCLLSLGEVGLESDTYPQAIEDFEECLRIQQEMLPKDSREMAHTHYHLGLTYSFINNYEKSAAYFADAIEILTLKASNLRKEIEVIKAKGGERGSLDDDPVWRAERDIEDIESLLPEIRAKLDDAKEMQREQANGPKDKVIGEMLNRTPEASPVKKETKANVISSNLIKRKRPLEETAGGAGSSSSGACSLTAVAGGTSSAEPPAEKKVKEDTS